MTKFKRDSNITILKKERPVHTLLETLIYFPADEVTRFFQEINLSFPRKLRIDTLRKVLRDPVNKTRTERATLADEMNYRLSWFNQYSEIQLINLLDFYSDPKINKNLLEELWLELINYMTFKKIAEKDFDSLINSSIKHAKSEGLKLPNIIEYNDKINILFFDEPGEIDGLTQDVIRPVLYKSSTLNEIRKLGTKYNVNVPRRLKKTELIDIIIGELKTRNEYTEEKEERLNKMSVLLIQRFAIDNKIKVSTELKKEEIIEYILANAQETKETYFVPSSSVYELEAQDVGESMPEVIAPEIIEEQLSEVIEEPVVEEEVIEEVIEEVEEPKTQVVHTVVKDEQITEEVKKLREEVEALKLKEQRLEVKETRLNTVAYKGTDAKKHRRLIEKEQNRQREEIITTQTNTNTQNTHEIYIAGFGDQGLPAKRKSPFWKRLLKGLVTIIVLLLILVLLYGMIRPVDGFTSGFMKTIDDILNVGGLLNKFTVWFKGLFN